MKTTTLFLALMSVIGTYSAQLAMVPVEGVYAAPLSYGEMTPSEAHARALEIAATNPTLFDAIGKLFEEKKNDGEVEKRDEDELFARDEEEEEEKGSYIQARDNEEEGAKFAKRSWVCPKCGTSFSRQDGLIRHQRLLHH